MDFDAWLSEQRRSIASLRVMAGEYVARYSPMLGTYSATLRLARSSAGTIVQVTRQHGLTRARVLHGGGEYDFVPTWTLGRGLTVARRSPITVHDHDTAVMTAGLARAALLKAAEEERDRLASIAYDTSEEHADAVLRHLTLGNAGVLEQPLREALADVLADLTGAELVHAPEACGCVVCGRQFRVGDLGPITIIGGSTTACSRCLHQPARAA